MGESLTDVWSPEYLLMFDMEKCAGAGDTTQLVKCLPQKLKDPSLIFSIHLEVMCSDMTL